jgi:hypothetical protein
MVYSIDGEWVTRRRLCDKQERTADQGLGFQEVHRIGGDDIKMDQRYIDLVVMILKWIKVS